jgi:DNA-binding transcriptional ArsR family regulator
MLSRVPPFPVPAWDGNLVGRRTGELARHQIEAHLARQPRFAIVPLDFGKVQFMDFSAADEVVAKLVKRILAGELNERYVVLYHLSNLLRENVQPALKMSQLVAVEERTDGTVELIGAVTNEAAETYKIAREQGKVTARHVTDQIGKSITASSNRLSRLKDDGLLAIVDIEAVESGGRQNVYAPIE